MARSYHRVVGVLQLPLFFPKKQRKETKCFYANNAARSFLPLLHKQRGPG